MDNENLISLMLVIIGCTWIIAKRIGKKAK